MIVFQHLKWCFWPFIVSEKLPGNIFVWSQKIREKLLNLFGLKYIKQTFNSGKSRHLFLFLGEHWLDKVYYQDRTEQCWFAVFVLKFVIISI